MTIDRTHRSTRLRSTLAAGAAALAGTAALAAAGSAQTAPTALHLVAKTQRSVGFAPRHAPRQGDRIGFGAAISGDRTGISRTVCTVIGSGGFGALCTIHTRLNDGTLTAQGLVGERSRNAPVAITGGTGAYDGARGTAFVTDVNSKTTNIEVALRP